MPGKPSRRDRRRGVGHSGNIAVRRPRPAPPVAPERLSHPEGERDYGQEGEREAEQRQEQQTGAPPATVRPVRPGTIGSAPLAASRARPSALRPERRGPVTASARALEAQRDQRVRREAVRDLKRIAVTAAITLAALVAAAVFLP